MAETKSTTTQTRIKRLSTSCVSRCLWPLCWPLWGFAGKNNAAQQNAELTAQLEELTARRN